MLGGRVIAPNLFTLRHPDYVLPEGRNPSVGIPSVSEGTSRGPLRGQGGRPYLLETFRGPPAAKGP